MSDLEPPQLQRLRDALTLFRDGKMGCDEFVSLWRSEGGALCAQLPKVYQMALDDLLQRIESSRLFAGDSCSFSRDGLIEACAAWIDKVKLRIMLPGG